MSYVVCMSQMFIKKTKIQLYVSRKKLKMYTKNLLLFESTYPTIIFIHIQNNVILQLKILLKVIRTPVKYTYSIKC